MIRLQFTTDKSSVTVYVDDRPAFVMSNREAREMRQRLNQAVRDLRPDKDWTNCPYEGHVDDCNCNGMGGDR